MNTQNVIRAIIFDLGNVLVQVNFANMLIHQPEDSLNKSPQEVIEAAYRDDLFKQFCKGEIDSLTFYKRLTEKYDLDMSFEAFKEKWCDIFEPMEGMPEMLNILKIKYNIGLLSDTDPIHWQYVLNAYPYLQTIKKPALSFEIGFMKPHPQTYRTAADYTGYPLQNCLFIDDRMVNVKGARKLGMEAVHFENPEKLRDMLREMQII